MTLCTITPEQKQNIYRAALYAKYCHREAKQFRKYSGELYETHPEACVQILEDHSHEVYVDHLMYQIMWLHDTVEDTKATYASLVLEFGMEVGLGVYYLTNNAKEGASKEQKIEEQITRMQEAPSRIQTLKYVDIIHNTSDCLECPKLDLNWARNYGRIKMMFLEEVKGGHQVLWKRAYESSRAFSEL